jgi:hypothetical protein
MIASMGRLLSLDRMRADFVALEANIRRAGCALACPYSSSDEFEAAVIRARRHAGIYGPRRHRRAAIVAGIVTGALVVVLLII